jgi:transcriptional regulator with XRE-family HTH domain
VLDGRYQMPNPAYGLEFRRARREKQLTQVAVAKTLGVSQSYIAQLEAGRSHPSAALASRISDLLGLGPPARTDTEHSRQIGLSDIGRPFALAELADNLGAAGNRLRLPIVGAPVPGDEERIIIDGQSHGFVLAPPQLEHVPGSRALYVRGRSMEPRYYPGELVYISPRRPNPGDFVLALVREPRFAAPIGYIRQYLGEDSGQVLLATLNPKGEQRIAREDVVSVSTIVGSGLL